MNKEQIIKYLENNELDVQNASATACLCDLVYTAYANAQKVIKNNLKVVFCYLYFLNLHTDHQTASHNQFSAKKPLVDIERTLYQEFLKDKKSIGKKMKKHKQLEDNLDKLWANYLKVKSKITKKQELDFFNKLIKYSREWWHYGLIGENKGDIISSEIVPEFAKRHNWDIKKTQEIFNLLSHPEERSVLSSERKKFLEICVDVLNSKNPGQAFENKEILKKIKQHTKECFWFKTNTYKAVEITPNFFVEEINREIKEKGKEKILEEYADIDKNFKELEKKKKQLLKEIVLSKKDGDDIYFAKQLIVWQDLRKEGMMKDFYYFLRYVDDLGQRRNLKYNDLAIYTLEELKNLIKAEKLLDEETACKRERGILFVWERNKKVKLLCGSDAKEIFEIATKIKTTSVAGQVASKGGLGLVQGRAQIIFDPSKEKFEEGCILVTSMTRIEFVPLMRKAKAIITNEGGIACHAAIVSRELGIPCIIGTKNATRLLKTGDNVEMDLEKGTVRLLK